jgi:hypothetical protein
MSVAEQIVAGAALLVCGVLLLRLALGERRRARFDAAAQYGWERVVVIWRATVRRTGSRRDPEKERVKAARAASREADAVIRRAQSQARDAIRKGTVDSTRPESDVQGNVIRPKAFRRPDSGASRSDSAGTHPGNDTLH